MKKRELGKEVETRRRARFFLSKKIETAIKSLHRNLGSVRLSFIAVRVAIIGTETEVEYGLLLLYACIYFSTSFEVLSCTETEFLLTVRAALIAVRTPFNTAHKSRELSVHLFLLVQFFWVVRSALNLAQKSRRVYGWFAEHSVQTLGKSLMWR